MWTIPQLNLAPDRGEGSNATAMSVSEAGDAPAQPSTRVAVITVHGVADQQPGQTVRELARLLCHGGGELPRCVDGEVHEVLVPVAPLAPTTAPAGEAPTATVPSPSPHAPTRTPGRPSDFYLRRRGDGAGSNDVGLALTDHLLARYRPDEADGLYASTRVSLRRRADGTPVDLYELYWADCSRLRPGGIRALSASYQLLFHLSTLARDVVDQVAMAQDAAGAPHRGLGVLQRLHAWSAWLLTGPAALLQLAMLLLVLFGATAYVPDDQVRVLLVLGGSSKAVVLAIGGWLVARHADGAWAALLRALPWLAAAAVGAGVALGALADDVPTAMLYAISAGLGVVVLGAVLLDRFGRTARGVRTVGGAILAATAGLLLWHGHRDLAHVTTMFE